MNVFDTAVLFDFRPTWTKEPTHGESRWRELRCKYCQIYPNTLEQLLKLK